MSRMKQAVLTLVLVLMVASAAHAQDTLGERVDSVTQSAREAIESVKTGARKQVGRVTDRASSTADDVAEVTS